jgi:hypothetical protein
VPQKFASGWAKRLIRTALGRYGLQTVTRRRPRGRFRAVGAYLGGLAGIAMIVVGCQSLTDGNPTVDPRDATNYRASVSSASVESSSRSAASESTRQVSITKQAVHTSCEALSITSVNAVDAVNAFVHAVNENEPGQEEKSVAAVDALHASADSVAASLSEPLSDELEGLLNDWIAAARNVADVISQGFEQDQFNAAVDRLNDVKVRALGLCDASY